jgi:uncharacterized protein (TIGR02646 family)
VRALVHFRDTPDEDFDFKVYKNPDVARALNELFHGKCAYCESSIKAVQPTDIEHFRPKGRVADCPGHPGYWWLAASWSNLLASCIDCNRQRYHDIEQLDKDRFSEDQDWLFKLGKGDLFPILGATYAHCATDDHDLEDAALIDPTRRDPADHLVWLEERALSLIGPRPVAGGHDPRGYYTYRVFGLNRQGLVEERTSLMRNVRAQIAFIEQMLDGAIQMPEPFSSRQRDQAFEQFLSLDHYAQADKPYSAMVANLLELETVRLQTKYQTFVA